MGVSIDEVKNMEKGANQRANQMHEAKERYTDPSKALDDMRGSDEYEGKAFTPHEISTHMRQKLLEAQGGKAENPDEWSETWNSTADYFVKKAIEDSDSDQEWIEESGYDPERGWIGESEEIQAYVASKLEESNDVEKTLDGNDIYFYKKNDLEG